MRHADVTLDDKFLLTEGRVFITGVQALLRVMMDQHRLDKAAGLNTAGFVSGYRGSPLGGLDQQAGRAGKFLKEADVVFKEGLNEDLAATAVWGSAASQAFPGRSSMACSGMWYGKAPGVDRTGDRLQARQLRRDLARRAACSPWPATTPPANPRPCPPQSEFAFQDFEMPVLSPADVQEVLDYGLMGWIAMSRFSGLWVGLIALADTMDSGVTIDVGPGPP